MRVPHQGIMEFVAAVTRSNRGHVICRRRRRFGEAEESLTQFIILYPNESIVREAMRACAV